MATLIDGRSFISVDPATNRLPEAVEQTLPAALGKGQPGGLVPLDADGDPVDAAGNKVAGGQVTTSNLSGGGATGRAVLAAPTIGDAQAELAMKDLTDQYLTLANPAFDPAAPPTSLTAAMIPGLLTADELPGVAGLDENRFVPVSQLRADTVAVLWNGADWTARNVPVTTRPNAWHIDLGGPSSVPTPAWVIDGDTRRYTDLVPGATDGTYDDVYGDVYGEAPLI